MQSRKPKDANNKSAYIVDSGLASLTAVCETVRDGQMKGELIHVLEKILFRVAQPTATGIKMLAT